MRRACQEERNQPRVLACPACPKEADGTGRGFKDRAHLTDEQVKHFFAKGAGRRPVMCRACQEERNQPRVL
eukprot:2433868-Pyramimonas_sp.AAC.1